VVSAGHAVAGINPEVKLVEYHGRIGVDNARELVRAYDVVADGSDNFPTRFLVNDACFFEKRTLVSAAVLRFDGQLSTFKPHAGGPCYRCIYPEPPPPGQIPSCDEAGVLGAVAGVLGTLQATEVLKELLGIGDSMAGRLLIYDALAATMRQVKVKPDPECPLCSASATIKELMLHT
jgi:adenylyltransferase/sulfurtransferase